MPQAAESISRERGDVMWHSWRGLIISELRTHRWVVLVGLRSPSGDEHLAGPVGPDVAIVADSPGLGPGFQLLNYAVLRTQDIELKVVSAIL